MEVVLALGGGGVKGYAHAGVIKVLEEAGIRIKAIAGTSAGGLWGALYCSGMAPDEITRRLSAADPQTLYAREPDDGPAMMGIAGIRGLLEAYLGDVKFSELKIPLAVTAVDLDHARRVVIKHGRVADAVYATIAVPGVFPPRLVEGNYLVDGGVLDPVPVSLARTLAPGIPVIAVVLSPGLEEWQGPAKPRLLNSLPFLATYLARLRIAQAMNIFLRSIDVAGAMLTELQLEYEQPEVIIRPDVPHIGLLDPVEAVEVMRAGERAAREALPAIRSQDSWISRMRCMYRGQKGRFRLKERMNE